ncbi:MAG: zinc-dependent metalloprotease, partial [Leptothrix sp. (in: b-proteobacteria)]
TGRDYANTGRDPLQPVPQAEQRSALDLLAGQVLSAQGLAVSPALQRRLAPDYLERAEALGSGDAMVATDYAPAQVLAELQQAVLAQLMSDGVASRLLDSEAKSDGVSLRLGDLYRRIDAEVWSELAKPGSEIGTARRELQRDHIDRMTMLLLHPEALNRADARSLLRSEARTLLPRLEAASRQNGLSEQTRAHLQDCALSLREALDARLVRTRG